ncbi:hypothetical protein CDL12_14093 [Handroanthus impetiginosus]|uniref:F-box domain-containing protein n=1 Tax=Handroanthus impetiginosus TaxID=429701 RepID=A0A2G9H6Y7_9LAMI|nr:hypothetical protein CDL12_14093 [Handroanthus impetiginosus]
MELSDQSFHIPEEILREILLKLPPKSLFRFRCVSKNWLSVISHPSFFTYYISHSKYSYSPPFMIIFQGGQKRGIHSFVSICNTLKSFKFPILSDRISGLKVKATSDDLILYELYRQEHVYFIVNPFTNQILTLPKHSETKSYGLTGLTSYVKNGITSYSVVRLVKDCKKTSLNLEVFSSQRGEWRNLEPRICTFNVEVDERPCVEFRGKLHWICNKMTTLLACDPCSNECSNECRFFGIPNEAYIMKGKNAILGVSGEDLFYFEMNRISIQECKFPRWKLWVMKDYEQGEWSLIKEGKERKIETFGVLCNVLLTYSALLPIMFHRWDKDLVYFWHEGYVLSFNVRTGWFED